MGWTRVIAVGNRIRLAATVAAYEAELERIVGMAAPHLAPERANLICLTEALGLPAALTGARAAIARRARTAEAALTLLGVAYLPEVMALRRRWPGISLARALLLARADALYRPMARTLARLAGHYGATIVATTFAPRLRAGLAVDGPVEAAGPEIYNAGLVFGPEGTLVGRVDKVYLTASEKELLDLSAGTLQDVALVTTTAGRLGVAISLDAFTPEYLARLDALGAEIVVQPDANDQPWAAASKTWEWQPEEWLRSTLGSIQPQWRSLKYNVCAMQTGMLFDLVFDGQSSVTAREAAPPTRPGQTHVQTYVGVEAPRNTLTGEPLVGGFLALSPWVAPDPAETAPGASLAERRKRLESTGRRLRAEDYRESVIWADVPLEG